MTNKVYFCLLEPYLVKHLNALNPPPLILIRVLGTEWSYEWAFSVFIYQYVYKIPVKAHAIVLHVQHKEYPTFLFFLERKKEGSLFF